MNGDVRAAIELRDVRKSFGDVVALDGLDVSVPTGSICGFLGPNGAGKTTTIRLLLGMARADGGEVRVLSRDTAVEAASVEVRRRTGFVSEAKEFYPHMRVAELIRFTRGFYPGWRADRERELLREFELPAQRGVQQLSKGMRSKLALLLACCRGAELLILSLPITRRRLVLVRATVGILCATALLAAVLLSLWLIAPGVRELAATAGTVRVVAYVAQILAAVAVASSVSALFATRLDDIWYTYAALAVVVTTVFGVPAVRFWTGTLATGVGAAPALSTGAAVLLAAALTAGILALAVTSVRHREF